MASLNRTRTRLAARLAIGGFVFGGLLAPVASAQTPAPAGVAVPVKLSDRLASDSAKAGERFTFTTTQTVQIGDVSVPAGTPGHGVVVGARSARWDRGGDLTLKVQSLDLPDGSVIAVAAAPHAGPHAEGQNVAGQALKTAESLKSGSVASALLVPLSAPVRGIVLLGSALKILKGHNVVFASGTTFSVLATAPESSASP